jgi:hypothetical protein
MFRPCLFAPQTFEATRVLDQHPGVETRHDRLVQTDVINPADAACSGVCIPAVATLFLRE